MNRLQLRRHLIPIIPSVLSAFIICFQLIYPERAPWYFLVIGIALILVAYYVIDHVNRNYLDIQVVDKLRRIINSSTRDRAQVTTINQFLIDSEEAALISGDEVHILTNSIRRYDATPEALKVISGNLTDNVQYIYYFYKDDYIEFEDEKNDFITKIQNSTTFVKHNVIERNLVFYEVLDPCVYNFAIVKRSGEVRGYWYTMIPSETTTKDDHLVITALNRDNTTQLLRVFHFLRRSARQVKAFG